MLVRGGREDTLFVISSKLDEKDGTTQHEEEMAERYLNEGFWW